jgi:hypothetical protein
MIGSLILAIASVGVPAAADVACVALSPQLEIIRRTPVRFPDNPVSKVQDIRAGGVVVFEIEVNEKGEAARVTAICNTVAAWIVRAAEQSVRRWRFKAQAHEVGQIEVHFQ